MFFITLRIFIHPTKAYCIMLNILLCIIVLKGVKSSFNLQLKIFIKT